MSKAPQPIEVEADQFFNQKNYLTPEKLGDFIERDINYFDFNPASNGGTAPIMRQEDIDFSLSDRDFTRTDSRFKRLGDADGKLV